MYKQRARWTTKNGSLIPNGEPYSITAEQLREFGPIMPDGAGCQVCIFVRLEGGPAKSVFFETVAGYHETHDLAPDGWAHTSMANPGSGYNPTNNKGPWTVQAEGAPSDVVDDIGLPFGWHVSTFVVLTWVGQNDEDNGEGPTPIEPPVGSASHVQVMTYIDGVLVMSYDNEATK